MYVPFGSSARLIHMQNRLNPQKTRKRHREVEEAINYISAKRLRQRPQQLLQFRGHKRLWEALDLLYQIPPEAPQERAQLSLRSPVIDAIVGQEVSSNIGEGDIDPIGYWVRTNCWPKEHLKQSHDNTSHLFARKKSSASLRRKRSEPASVAPSSAMLSYTIPISQKPREVKSVPYRDPRYRLLLSTKGSFMKDSSVRITEKRKQTYRKLLNAKQKVPSDSLFRDNISERTRLRIKDGNEATVIRFVSPLIVPHAQGLSMALNTSTF